MTTFRLSLLLAASTAALAIAPAHAAQINQTLSGHSLRLENLFANVQINLDSSAQGVTIAMAAPDEYVGLASFRTDGDVSVMSMRAPATTGIQ